MWILIEVPITCITWLGYLLQKTLKWYSLWALIPNLLCVAFLPLLFCRDFLLDTFHGPETSILRMRLFQIHTSIKFAYIHLTSHISLSFDPAVTISCASISSQIFWFKYKSLFSGLASNSEINTSCKYHLFFNPTGKENIVTFKKKTIWNSYFLGNEGICAN